MERSSINLSFATDYFFHLFFADFKKFVTQSPAFSKTTKLCLVYREPNLPEKTNVNIYRPVKTKKMNGWQASMKTLRVNIFMLVLFNMNANILWTNMVL